MSKFTGKCDFCDHCEMLGDPKEVVKRTSLYLGDAKVEIKSETDLIPYYTHLVASGCYNKDSGDSVHLSMYSFIDDEEKDHISWKIFDVITAARKAKKEKTELCLEFLKQQKFYWKGDPSYLWYSIIDIVKKNPDIIKNHIPRDYRDGRRFIKEWLIPNYFSNIHDPMHNRYREEFIKFCGDNGYSIIKWNEDFKTGERTEGKYHPIVTHMCFAISEYYKMVKTVEEEYKKAEEVYNVEG